MGALLGKQLNLYGLFWVKIPKHLIKNKSKKKVKSRLLFSGS